MSNTNIKEVMTYEDFTKLDVRVGTIVNCERVKDSEKLLRLEVDFGPLGLRQILSGIAKWYLPEELIGVQTTFVVNLPTRKMMGFESQGMLFALGLDDAEKPILLISKAKVANGNGAR